MNFQIKDGTKFSTIIYHISTEVGYFYLMKNDTLTYCCLQMKKEKGK